MPVGVLTQGQLNSSTKFYYDKPARLTIQLVDGAGVPLAPGSVGTTDVTVVASLYSGASNATVRTITGTNATIENLWPTTYGAYYGADPPVSGYTTVAIGAGETKTLDVPVFMAKGTFANLPSGTTSVIAVPGAAATCGASGAVTLNPSAQFSLLPGSWSFLASGDKFACSPGPANQSLVYDDGRPQTVSWDATTLTVTGAPAGDLWAVSRSKATGVPIPSTSCPDSSYAPVALDIKASRTGFIAIPAGDWYVYVTASGSGPAGPCVGVPYNLYSIVIPYASPTTLAWAFQPALVSVTGAPMSRSDAMLVSKSSAVPDCTRYSSGVGDYSTMSTSGSAYVGLLDPGTWYFFSWNQRRDSQVTGARCVLGGTVIVGGSPTGYTLPFSTTAPVPVVGP